MGSANPTVPNPPPLPPPSSSSSSPQRPQSSPPRPASAALPIRNGSGDPPNSPQRAGSGGHNSDDPSSASGGTLPMKNEDGSRVPMEETNPESTYTPEPTSDTPQTQEGEQAILDRAEKLNEPVQESRDGERAEEEEEEEEEGATASTGRNEKAGVTTE